jgi:hypothetical protein
VVTDLDPCLVVRLVLVRRQFRQPALLSCRFLVRVSVPALSGLLVSQKDLSLAPKNQLITWSFLKNGAWDPKPVHDCVGYLPFSQGGKPQRAHFRPNHVRCLLSAQHALAFSHYIAEPSVLGSFRFFDNACIDKAVLKHLEILGLLTGSNDLH